MKATSTLMTLKIVSAATLALPAALFLLCAAPIAALLSAPAMFLLLFRKIPPASAKGVRVSPADTGYGEKTRTETKKHPPPVHVIVTGGSSGIGLAIAREAAGAVGTARVTILARNAEKLRKAREEILAAALSEAEVEALSVDVTDPQALADAAQTVFAGAPKGASYKTLVFCCAGESVPEHFGKISSDEFLQQVQINQLGCIYTVQAFLPYIKEGTVSLCSSAAGQVGVYGFTAYSPTKFALRGFAEALHIELCDRPIHVQVAFPPDTDTPGFHDENKRKPKETALISETAGLATAESVGRAMFESACRDSPPFQVYFGALGFVVSTLCCGLSPVTGLADATAQVVLTPLFRIAALFLLQDWYRIVHDCGAEKERPVQRA